MDSVKSGLDLLTLAREVSHLNIRKSGLNSLVPIILGPWVLSSPITLGLTELCEALEGLNDMENLLIQTISTLSHSVTARMPSFSFNNDYNEYVKAAFPLATALYPGVSTDAFCVAAVRQLHNMNIWTRC